MSKRKYSEDQLITRSLEATFRALEDEDQKGVIEGTPIVFNQDTVMHSWDGDYYERIDAHALDNANLDDVRLFINHETNKITLARSKRGNPNSTMSFRIDENGFHIRAVLDIEENMEARAIYSSIKRGDTDGMSFMFRIKDYEWQGLDTEMPTLIIKSISIVHEVSVVNFPAYPQTSVNARCENEETSSSLLAEAKKAYAEETARSKELEIKKQELELAKLKNLYL